MISSARECPSKEVGMIRQLGNGKSCARLSFSHNKRYVTLVSLDSESI